MFSFTTPSEENMNALSRFFVGSVIALYMACAGAEEVTKPAAQDPAKSESSDAWPEVAVYKNPTCGCCKVWIEHLEKSGLKVSAHDVDDMGAIKEQAGVPYGMGSCHTAKVGGYFIEGHVPADEIKRLLTENPKAKGITVPGMPIGSPGMESGDRVDPYKVYIVNEDGTADTFAEYPKQ